MALYPRVLIALVLCAAAPSGRSADADSPHAATSFKSAACDVTIRGDHGGQSGTISWDAGRGGERGVERATERETSRAADRAVTGAIQSAEDAVVCLVTDRECTRRAEAEGWPVEVQDKDGNVVEQRAPSVTGVDVNNAVEVGTRVLFYEDYTGDTVGDFPRGLEFMRGNWEVATWQGRRLLRNSGSRMSAFLIALPETLPDTVTVETEIHITGDQRLVMLTQPSFDPLSQVDYNWVQVTHGGGQGTSVTANRNFGLSTSLNRAPAVDRDLVPLQIRFEGDYVKVFAAGDRVSNVPNAYFPRSEVLQIVLPEAGSEDRPVYLGPIRIATSLPE